MACLCVYMRKCTTLAQRDKSWLKEPKSILDTVDVGEAFNNSLMLCTQGGKLLYIGEKAQDVFGLKFVSPKRFRKTGNFVLCIETVSQFLELDQMVARKTNSTKLFPK